MPLGHYLQQLWQRRYFITSQARAQFVAGNSGFALGNLWLFVGPILDAGVYFFLFEIVMQSGRGIPNFVAFLVIGVFTFSYSQRSITACAGVIASNKGLVRAFSFPRMALPLAALFREFLSTLPVKLVMLLFVAAMPPHVYPTTLWLLLPVMIALQTGLNLGLGLIVARLTNAVPDLNKLVRYGLRLWMYSSCVMFSIDRLAHSPALQSVFEANPAFIILDMTRDLVMYDTVPEARSWLTIMAWAVGAAVLGFVYFWRGETTYGRE